MDAPTMFAPRRVAPDTDQITAYLPIPGLGVLPVSSFVVHAKEPVLVDAGVIGLRENFLHAIESTIELSRVRWIWLTHTDPDHVGCLDALLEKAPNARLVTTFLGMGKLGLTRPIPPDRVHLLNPGQTLDVGDRHLVAFRPPAFDAPETTGLFDSKNRVLFSADSFGALLSAPAESARDIRPEELCEGLVTWTSVDAPWLPSVRKDAFEATCRTLTDFDPETVLGSHLPEATGMLPTLIRYLEKASTAPPFVGPDQEALLRTMSAA